jgi:hypothetical protein
MPIRLLCFKPHKSAPKISLLERSDIYNYLAQKFLADFHRGHQFVPDFWVQGRAEYAILSHTWTQTPGELTYGDWQRGSLSAVHPKSQKLVNFCRAAWEHHGLTLGWIDTICINKDSSAELDESIRSMYAWYRNAEVCITYLAATHTLSDMHNDPWFTRGWTFQEMVAPQYLKFYNKDWNQLSSSESSDTGNEGHHLILEEIRFATTMTPSELQHIRGVPISRRMQLAATRQVTRKEDIAYCLMGIFDVSISTAYGEGAERAFFRLVEEIFRSTKDISDIFNWAGGRTSVSREPITSLFPLRPADYLHRSSNNMLRPWRPIEPLTLTHLGLRTPILLMPAVPIRGSTFDNQPIGEYHASVQSISSVPSRNNVTIPANYHLLDNRASGPEAIYECKYFWEKEMTQKTTLTFGTLNVEEQGTRIRISKTCLAVLLRREIENTSAGGTIILAWGSVGERDAA